MNITFLTAGKTHEKAVPALTEKYVKEISKNCKFAWIETRDVKARSAAEIRKKEAQIFKEHISNGDHLVLLDETGTEYNSVEFGRLIRQRQMENKKHLVFLLGGAYGFDESIYAIANEKLSLSRMTFPHQLVRVIFLEQLYRAFSILNNQPYHH